VSETLIPASDVSAWRRALAGFPAIDVCQTPEYHLAYATRTPGAEALLWMFEADGKRFGYPFLSAPVGWQRADGGREETGYSDISGIYGYSGPLSTSEDPRFLGAAWDAFGKWARHRKAIAEFIRYSPHAGCSG
jgi:hypothetical protein